MSRSIWYQSRVASSPRHLCQQVRRSARDARGERVCPWELSVSRGLLDRQWRAVSMIVLDEVNAEGFLYER